MRRLPLRLRGVMRDAGRAGASTVLLLAFVLGSGVWAAVPRPRLWVDAGRSLFKVSPALAEPLLEIKGLAGVRALAVDRVQDRIWVVGRRELLLFGRDGGALVAIRLPHGMRENQRAALVVSDRYGAVFLGVGRDLDRFSFAGRLIWSQKLRHALVALTFDPTRGRLWLDQGRRIAVRNVTGGKVMAIRSGSAIPVGSGMGEAEALVYDPALDEVWVAGGDTLERYEAASGVGVFTTRIAGGFDDFLAPDGSGNLWAAGERAIGYLTGSGDLARTVRLGSRIQALAADPLTRHVWVALRHEVLEYARDGERLATIPVTDLLGSDRACPGRILSGRARSDPAGFNRAESDRTVSGRDCDRKSGIRHLVFYANPALPQVSIVSPEAGAAVNDARIPIVLALRDRDSTVDAAAIAIMANGVPLAASCIANGSDTGATCTPETGLPEGTVTLRVTVTDRAGHESAPATVVFTVETVPPVITLVAPAGTDLDHRQVVLAGQVSQESTLTVNGAPVSMGGNSGAGALGFTDPVTLVDGPNRFVFVATDRAGNVGTLAVTLDYAGPPAQPDASLITVGDPVGGDATVTGAPGAVGGGDLVTVTDLKTGATVTVRAGANGSFVAVLAAGWGDPLRITTADPADPDERSRSIHKRTGHIPPHPSRVAPPLPIAGEEPFAEATAFLYSGSNPVQTGVVPGTILPYRAAVIRGQVVDRSDHPLAGVVITVLNHPAFGYTVSRPSGRFDLAVDGGGWLTLDYMKTGYLEAQRSVRTPWQDYAIAPTVALIHPDAKRNPVVFGQGAPLQVARGSRETDASGTRRATVIIPAGTLATWVAPDGHKQALNGGDVRITEVTVGPMGPETMPAKLPATSSYTYAVDLAVGPELTDGGKVVFSQPVDLYVNDFLKFPAGTVVPDGTYRFDQGKWVAQANGIVLRILTVRGGLATVDLDGKGVAATPAELVRQGFTDAELMELARLYKPGTLLWRVPLRHFSLQDTNWVAYQPQDGPVDKKEVPQPDCQKLWHGCEILSESQALVERIPLAGTGIELDYDSARSTNRYSVEIPLTDAHPPTGLGSIRLKVEVEGQSFERTFAPGVDLNYRYVWNGLDVYGRKVVGHVLARISVGYVYPGFYYEGTPFFGAYGSGTFVTGKNARLGATIWRDYTLPLGQAPGDLAAGWTLSGTRFYDATARTVYRAGGLARSASDHPDQEATVMGAPAGIQALTLSPGGVLYAATATEIYARSVAGAWTHLAGSGGSGDLNGPALSATFADITGLALGPSGTLYIADEGDNEIRALSPADSTGGGAIGQTVGTVAGDGTAGETGDGGSALSAELDDPVAVALAPDGTLFVADDGSGAVRRIGTDGVITTVGGVDPSGALVGIGVGPRGSVYVGQSSTSYCHDLGEVSRIDTDGAVAPLACLYLNGEGALEVALDGSIYGVGANIEGRGGPYLSRVGRGGAVHTLVSDVPDLGAPFVVNPEGEIFFASASTGSLEQLSPIFPPPAIEGYRLPSAGGQTVEHFNGLGQETEVVSALTGSVLETFAYDAAGDLISVRDAFGNTVTIGYAASGEPVSIIAPGGEFTTLATDSAGDLVSVTSPGGRTWRMGYDAGGLLLSFARPGGGVDRYAYDSAGRLIRNVTPIGGGNTLVRTVTGPDSYTVTRTDALGRSERVALGVNNSWFAPWGFFGGDTDSDTLPDGATDTTMVSTSGLGQEDSYANGTQVDETLAPDPRFGSVVEYGAVRTICMGSSGACETVNETRNDAATNPEDPFGGGTLTDDLTVNGRYRSALAFASDTWTLTDPLGLKTSETVNGEDQPLVIDAPGMAPLDYRYTAQGRVAEMRFGSGSQIRETRFAYDPQGFLSGVTDALGETTAFRYDPDGELTGATLPGGETIGMSYDADGNLATLTPAGEPSYTFGYSAADELTRFVPPAVSGVRRVTQLSYNVQGQPTEILEPDGTSIGFGYARDGLLTSVTAAGLEETLSYNPAGQLAAIDGSGGERLAFSWQGMLRVGDSWSGPVTGSVSRVLTNRLRTGTLMVDDQQIGYVYDADGALVQAGDLTIGRSATDDFLTGTRLGAIRSSVGYDAFGEMDAEAFTYHGPESFTFTATASQTTVTNPMVTITGRMPGATDIRVSASNQTEVTDYPVASDGSFSVNYDLFSLGLPAGSTATLYVAPYSTVSGSPTPTPAAIHFTYAPEPPPDTYQAEDLQSVAPGGMVYYQGSDTDSMNQEWAVPAGGGIPTAPALLQDASVVAAGAGGIVYFVGPGDILWEVENGSTVQVADLSGYGAIQSLTVTPAGVVYFTTRDSRSVYEVGTSGAVSVVATVPTAAYSKVTGRAISGVRPEIVAVSDDLFLSSSVSGVEVLAASSGVVYKLGSKGALTEVAQAPGTFETFALAPDGMVCFGGAVRAIGSYFPGTDTITCKAPAGTGSTGTITTETAAGPVVDLGFDAVGDLYYVANGTVYRYGAGGSINLIEEPTGRSVTGIVTVVGTESVPSSIYSETLTRDALGRIVGEVETVGGQTERVQYRYDRAGRLVAVYENGVEVGSYGYNGNGDRLADGAMQATYNADDELVEEGGTRFTYDAEGDLVREETAGGAVTGYRYNGLGELVGVDLPDGVRVGYLYDGLGRRVGKEVDGKRVAGYLWSGGRLVGVLNGSGVLEETFVWGTRGNVPDEMVAHGQVYRILADARGSVRLVVDAGTGQVMQALRYSPWGRVIGDTDPGFQPFGYAGGLDDRRTGLERFGVRDYDPATGRWIEPDPILFAGGGTNLYAYTDDDPVDEVDPSGLLTVPFLDVWIPAGETQGAYAARYWANASQDSGNTWIETAFDDSMGVLASLWTPCTSNATATVLLASAAGDVSVYMTPQQRHVYTYWLIVALSMAQGHASRQMGTEGPTASKGSAMELPSARIPGDPTPKLPEDPPEVPDVPLGG